MSTEVVHRDMLLKGFFREMGKLLDCDIPHDIVYLIEMYHLKWMILGIGSNQHGMT